MSCDPFAPLPLNPPFHIPPPEFWKIFLEKNQDLKKIGKKSYGTPYECFQRKINILNKIGKKSYGTPYKVF